jgi:hypothetical protein
MRKFKHGTLKSSSGAKVTNPRQARAIAASYNDGDSDYKPNPGGQSARQQMHGLETAEPPESADDLDRMAARRKRKKKHGARRA